MTFFLGFCLVLVSIAAIVFGLLWYLQVEPVKELMRQYSEKLAGIELERAEILREADSDARRLRSSAEDAVETAASKVTALAERTRELEEEAAVYRDTARAMQNIVEGYGNTYLKPSHSLLDDLGEEFGHREAGERLKQARKHVRELVKANRSAVCDYAEPDRRKGAQDFVTDAFNGKVDSILSRSRHDNYGTLEQEIKDAFAMVNRGGEVFRNARINPEYLKARLEELRWAAAAHELKRREQEEQRQIRERIREEEKARRDFERAKQQAEKEEALLRKSMEEAQARLSAATAEQRSRYEAQLAELQAKLTETEARGERATSMAQQTRRGHVYVVSNPGSLGEDVFKIGLTRRLDPMDRIWELGDASVPFDYDVHAMIPSEDAPALETKLHREFLLSQVNKVNPRKEFFRVSLKDIRRELERLGIEAKWTMLAEAREWRETLAIEQAIATDPAAREQWEARQLRLDPVDRRELEVSPEEP